MKIHFNDLDIVYVQDYYDIPLKGFCRYNGQLTKFEIDDDSDFYNLIPLTNWQKLKALFGKWTFELCVGKHWTYKNGKQCGYFTGFTMLSRFYYWIKK